MPLWRSRELEALFGGRLDASGLTEAAFERLRALGVAETDQLDFKRVNPGEVPYPGISAAKTGWLDAQEFAKDVAALANHRGGVLLIGVGEDAASGVANKLTPVTVSTPEREQHRLTQALLNHQAPLADFYFVPVSAQDGSWFLALVVPPSERAPHAVTDVGNEKHPHRYPVRHDRGTRWLTEHEVAERYRRRQAAQEDHGNRVRRTVAEGCSALAKSDGVWLYLAAVPEFPVRDARLDAATLSRFSNWRQRLHLVSPLQRTLPASGIGTPAPGKVTFSSRPASGGDGETAIRVAYVELRLDGSAFAAKPTRSFPREREPDHEVGESTLVDDLVLLVNLALQWCADEAGTFGMATLVTGLIDANVEGGTITDPLTLVSESGPVYRARQVVGLPVATVTADLSAVDTLQQRLAVTHLVHSGLLHWFGLAESQQITTDGRIFALAYDGYGSHEVESWARNHGVPLTKG